jgi:arylsulfatase A-like enzyme
VLVLIDDMGWRDLACCGSTFYETPNLDRIRAEGMQFTDAYASCPVCSPTRASILTGKYPATVGITNYIAGAERGRLLSAPYYHALPMAETTVARALREGGYATWHVGKWHLGNHAHWPENHGFDVNIAGCEWGHPAHGYFAPWKNPRLSEGSPGEYLTDRLTDEAISLVRARDRSKPFFLNLWHYAVHTPIQVKPHDLRRFEEKARAMGLDKVQALYEGEHFPCEHKRSRHVARRVVQSDPAYAAMVWNLDCNVGRLMDAMKQDGCADDTLFIFTSDNGGLSTAEGAPTSNLPLAEGKGWMYEGGTREPMLVRWPGVVRPGSTCATPITSTDFYPTFLDAAGLPPRSRQHCDGKSFMPLLRGQAMDRGPIFWHYPHYGNQGGTPGSSVRDGDWKLIEFFETGRLELYNLRTDPGETRDLAAHEPQVASRLHELLRNWRQSVEAKIPQPNPDWRDE